MAVRVVSASLIVLASVVTAASQSSKTTAPESFKANAQITGDARGAAAVITVHMDTYTSDADHEAMVRVLKEGGHAPFMEKLRQAPAIGKVTVANRSVNVRWAREQVKDNNRRIVLVTDAPVFFFGAGATDAKPTAGYDLAVLEFTLDSSGLGSGTMAGAARVKPGGPLGVELDDYAGKRITLVTVSRDIS